MVNFIPHGRTTAKFKGYDLKTAHAIGAQHTGQDESKGYGRPWMSDNDGIAYKVYMPNADFEWAAVHMLVPDGDDWCEVIAIGHASHIVVREGDFVHKGQVVGYEGNHGLVASGGRLVTVEERLRGSRAGTHNHRGIRPIVLTDKLVSDSKSHYLRQANGEPYKHEGKFCKIKHTNNTYGYVDPLTYYPKNPADRIELMSLNKRVEGDMNQARILSAVAGVVRAFIKK